MTNLCLVLSGVCVFSFPFCLDYLSFVVCALLLGLFVSGYISLTSIGMQNDIYLLWLAIKISNNHIALFNDILMLLLLTLNCSSGGFVGYRLSYVDIWPIGAFQRDCISTRPTARWIGIWIDQSRYITDIASWYYHWCKY